jgi:EAL domain-containing protein (putative c-di-GMP-specific phosphodiesterase class I)/CHASE2 domain-containing sensor protein
MTGMFGAGRNLLTASAQRWRILAVLLAALVGVASGAWHVASGVEHAIQNARSAALDHPASGTLALVEVDARSIAAIDRWPWPRRNFAQAVDRLHRAGAASIAFDVDFSSRSVPEDDAALAAALRRAGGAVVLPTLRQSAGGGDAGFIDTMPIPELRANAMAAAVSILPDEDGQVRSAPMGIVTDGAPRPSLSAMLANRAGGVGVQFPIDYAIDPASIPRHSFIDIRDGRFDPAAIAGKHVLIGATAVEIGDRYAVPRYGVVPGVVIQALAAETLMAGMPRSCGWLLPLLLALALAPAILLARSPPLLAMVVVLALTTVFGLSLGAEWAFGCRYPLVPSFLALLVVSIAAALIRLAHTWRERRLHDEATGMGNRAAMTIDLAGRDELVIATARIVDYDKLHAALGSAGVAELVCRVRDRINTLGSGLTIYRVEDRVLAWQADVGVDLVQLWHEQLRRMMLLPIEVKGRHADVTLAIGVAVGSGTECAGVLANAALAASEARGRGTGWHVHSSGEGDAASHEISLLGELGRAVDAGEIRVLYQPKLDIASGRITSVEALVRWQHPVRGLLGPDLFIPLAERNDRIGELTMHVLQRTIDDVREWGAAGHRVCGAVNISAKLLNSSAFLDDVAALIHRTGIDPDRLILEVTESATMTDPTHAARSLSAIKALGVAISMDDYGTGQSTLTYLKQLPLDELKLDRSFVQFAHQNRSDAVLVRSTVELAHELGLKVVAEGVEDAACLAYLASIGCDVAQGYLISKPVPAAAITDLLGRRLALAA